MSKPKDQQPAMQRRVQYAVLLQISDMGLATQGATIRICPGAALSDRDGVTGSGRTSLDASAGTHVGTDTSYVGRWRMIQRMLYTPVQAAETLGIGRSKLCELIESGQLESIHIGACRAFRTRL
jgi:excisionase family DNA binding protein